MTDTNPSGAPSAPAADPSAPAASAETSAGHFGSTRGSGLARGKRHTGAPAPTADTSAPADFKPASIEVITPKSEYVNPFASPEPASPPAEPAKVESIAAEPAPVAPPAPAVQPEAFALRSAPVVQHPPAPVHEPVADEAPAEKRGIEILPPAEDVRPAVSWESPSAASARPSNESRPVFRPDRRDGQSSGVEGANPSQIRPAFGSEDAPREPRQPRDPRNARQPRDPRDVRQPRDPREAREPREPRQGQDKYGRQPRDPRDYEESPRQREQAAPAAVAPAPKGFFGWLKNLFGGGAKPAPAPATREGYNEHPSEGQHRRRRHRGGRGHGGQGGQGGPQGFRGERSPSPGGEREGQGGERHGGSRRRRHRGGRDRDRGPRSEGQQGGGAI